MNNKSNGVFADYAAVVFDLDGTLLDSHDLIARTVNRVLEKRGHPVAEVSAIGAMSGLPLHEIFEAVLPAADQEQALACIDEYRLIFDREVVPSMQPIPGAKEALRRVAEGPWKMGVATGRLTPTAMAMLAVAGMAEQFETIVGVDLVPRPKPYPDVLLEALARLGGIAPSEVLYVGDTAADVAMCRAAGTPVCAVTWGAQPRDALEAASPHWVIDTWDELLKLLGLPRH